MGSLDDEKKRRFARIPFARRSTVLVAACALLGYHSFANVVSPELDIIKSASAFSSNTSIMKHNRNCFVAAMNKHGDAYTNVARPALFFMESSTFQAVFLGVPGDEEAWNNLNDKWKRTTSTLLLVGQLFQRASQRGFRSTKSAALIDVGANMGQEVVVAGLFGYRATTFEIVPRSAAAVKFNLAANCIQDDIVAVVNAGASKKSGSIKIEMGRMMHQSGPWMITFSEKRDQGL